MKKSLAKQAAVIAGGSFVCAAEVMGCYPIVPAYFAAVLLEDVNAVWLTGAMYIGMLYFMPLAAVIKYAVTILLIIGAVKLVQWANQGCPAYAAGALAAVSAMILSFCGGLLQWKDQPQVSAVFLEGIFIFGAVILFNRLLHSFFEWNRKENAVPVYSADCAKEQRLAGYAESFQGLSQIFLNMSQKKEQYTAEELGKMQNELTGRLCANCDCCAVCWEKDTAPLYGILSNLILEILDAGVVAEENEEELSHYCKYSRDMVEEAVRVFEKANLNRAWYNRLLENRQTIAEQLDAMAYIMQDCAKEEKILDRHLKKSLAEIRYRAREAGIVIVQLHFLENQHGHFRIECVLKSKMGGCVSAKTFMNAVSRVLGKEIRACADNRSFIAKDPVHFLFYEDTKYRSVQGIARMKKEDAQISGDNFSFLELEHGELMLGLSDGMGSGSSACRESEMVLDLMERFLEAGFSVETAIRMMNSAMVMKGESDLYSTMDLCKINLYDGQTEFYKIGAASAFIKSKNEVRCFSSESLPVGAGTNPDIECKKTKVKNGDFVVMMTDGVLEYLQVSNPEETMQEIIAGIDTNHPGVLAKKILEQVLFYTGGKAYDDMTVLTACIWEK